MDKRVVVKEGSSSSAVNVQLVVHLKKRSLLQRRQRTSGVVIQSMASESGHGQIPREDESVRHIDAPPVRRVVVEPPASRTSGPAASAHDSSVIVPDPSDIQDPSLLFESPDASPFYQFGERQIPKSVVFARTYLSYAFIPNKSAAPGHVLVCPLHGVPKTAKLAKPEVTDLFHLVHLVQRKLELYYGVDSSTVVVQDGMAPGQSSKHAHVHIVPKHGDVDYVTLYEKLREESTEGVRQQEEVEQEAAEYRSLFYAAGSGEVCKVRRRKHASPPAIKIAQEKPHVPAVKFKTPLSSSEDEERAAGGSIPQAPAPTLECECGRCRRNQCPKCVQVKKTVAVDLENAILSPDAAPRRTRSPKTGRKRSSKKSRRARKGRGHRDDVSLSLLQESEESQYEELKDAIGEDWLEDGKVKPQRSSACQIVIAGVFLGGAMIAVTSVVKSFR